jgi:hypothetical protein
MADAKSARGLRSTRVEFSKRGIEIGRADLTIVHGTLYIRGLVSVIRGAKILDLRSEVDVVAKVMRQKPEIKNVIVDCQYRDQ